MRGRSVHWASMGEVCTEPGARKRYFIFFTPAKDSNEPASSHTLNRTEVNIIQTSSQRKSKIVTAPQCLFNVDQRRKKS